MVTETQTNEQLLATLRDAAEELVVRLSNYNSMTLDTDCTNEAFALAARMNRVLYDTLKGVSASRIELERS